MVTITNVLLQRVHCTVAVQRKASKYTQQEEKAKGRNERWKIFYNSVFTRIRKKPSMLEDNTVRNRIQNK